MIPQFPKFKNLELSDQKEISKLALEYEPYSDFHFEIMWAWDVNESIKVSLLNKNLVILARNIYTNEVICSYLGNNKLDDTLDSIFEFLDTTGTTKPRISLVPEASLKSLNFKQYFIEIDLNTCDYVYELKHLSDYSGNKYTQKRGRSNTFVRNYPDVQVRDLDLRDAHIKEEILNLNNTWVQNKNTLDGIENEFLALNRFLGADFKDTYSLGAYDKEELIGFAIFSFHKDFAVNQFIKGNVSYKGIYEFLIKECATRLLKRGVSYLNYQEDMGIVGLRKAKLAYRPYKFLRKYFVNRL